MRSWRVQGRWPLSARRYRLRTAGLLALGLAAGACGSATARSASAPSTAPGAATRGSGPVDVLYAGSLLSLMDNEVGPSFGSATGYAFTGTSGDSGSLANEIKGRVEVGDVYISASAAKDALLEGPANGSWVSWYATFATSPLVIGYNPKSKFAAELATQPWYQVVGQPGFLLGRTDPATDPKGRLAVEALDQAATAQHEPSLAQLAMSTSNVYSENTLVGRLQAGQLDAGFFYGVEAKTAGIPTVSLAGSTLAARYTITVLAHAPHPAAAAAFVRYLLGSAGASALDRAGLVLARPIQVSGTAPADLADVLY